MANSEIKWLSVPGLEAAGHRLEAEAHRYNRIISDLYSKVNLVNPETFGDEKFFAKWEGSVREWDEGVRSVYGSILATSGGVFGMAKAGKATDDNTTELAKNFGKSVNGGLTNPNMPDIPPLPPTVGGTGGGNGGGSGPHGRH